MYQPLITFCPHPAIFTQVLRIFVVNKDDSHKNRAGVAVKTNCKNAPP